MHLKKKKKCTVCLQESLTLNKSSILGNSLVTAWVLVQTLASQDCFFSVKSKYTERVGFLFLTVSKIVNVFPIY